MRTSFVTIVLRRSDANVRPSSAPPAITRIHPSTYLGLADGLKEAATMRVASKSWSHWQEEVCWLTAYFSFAVWGSLFMAAAPPRFGRGRDPSSGGAAAGDRKAKRS